MKYSNTALLLLAAKEIGLIKSNAQFWKDYYHNQSNFSDLETNNKIISILNKLEIDLNTEESNTGFLCPFDSDFPVLNKKIKNNSDKPYILFYKGDINLLKDLNQNIAVIGHTKPDDEIINREIDIVKKLVDNKLIIVSGLAKGCDTIAHKACLKYNGKTIAILPTPINNIYPSENRLIADEIVENKGLLISEYYKEPISKSEAINRFVQRDRLQAMFSKAVILIASYRKGEGDSGSRHAMEAARKYEIDRFVMYNNSTDAESVQFGLNRDLIDKRNLSPAKNLVVSSINYLKSSRNENLVYKENYNDYEQFSLL